MNSPTKRKTGQLNKHVVVWLRSVGRGRGSLRLLAKGGYARMSLPSVASRIFAGASKWHTTKNGYKIVGASQMNLY